MQQNKVNDCFLELAANNMPYLSQWYMDVPIIISTDRYKELKKIQQLLYQAILYFVHHFEEYTAIFPVTDKMKQIITQCSPYSYRPGTYRPDFLLEADGGLKICEIGARFPLNGYFLSGIAEYIGLTKFPHSSNRRRREYERFLDYLFEYWGPVDTLCVLKGKDRPCDIKYYLPYFEKLGIKVNVLSPENIAENVQMLRNASVINEFNQMELMELAPEILKNIAASDALNDMRSIFLIHDKRFLAVLGTDNFLASFLKKEEQATLKNFLVPTYTRSQSPEKWEDAYRYKDAWLIKPFLLGKSEKVYAGSLCTEKEWKQIFDSTEIENMVLQPFIKQRKIRGVIRQQVYNDYGVGTLLCFDNQFFGPGLFRTSSYQITNRVDDRKMAPCFTDDFTIHKEIFIL